MKRLGKLVALCAFVVASAPALLAQNRAAYHFDNFDTDGGVRVVSPPAREVPPARKRRRVRLTASTSAPAAEKYLNATTTTTSVSVATRPRTIGMAAGQSLDGFTTGDVEVDRYIVESGTRHGVDPVLLYAIMHRESSFKKRAVSHKGARGLMQLMPGTAARFGVRNIFDPRQNIEGGARYMSFLLNLFDGDVPLSLAGYNAGEGAVMKYGRRIPPYSETREYVRRITERYALMRDPQAARRARVVTSAQVAQIKEQAASGQTPPSYERSVYSVRLPNGQLMLVSQ